MVVVTIVVAAFFMGIFSQHYGVVGFLHNTWKLRFSPVLDIPGNYFTGLSSEAPFELHILVADSNMKKIESMVEQALIHYEKLKDVNKYLPANVVYNGDTIPVDLRLKGGSTDHFRGKKISFRIKTSGEKKIWGLQTFSIQAPYTRAYLKEWLSHQFMKYEGLIANRYEFINVKINGKNKGIYALEENFGKEIIAENHRVEGPILKFDQDLFRVWNRLEKSEASNFRDRFEITDIIPFRSNYTFRDSALYDNFYTGKRLLGGFRSKQRSAKEVFDLQRAGRLFAVIDLLNAQHGLQWRNMRFYLNPCLNKLEVMSFDMSTGNNLFDKIIKTNYQRWRTDDYNVWEMEPGHWFELFFSDEDFNQAYFEELSRITKPGYLEEFLASIEEDLEKRKAIIHKDYPAYYFDLDQLYYNRDFLASSVTSGNRLKVYQVRSKDGPNNFKLAVQNSLFLPIEIEGVISNKDSFLITVERYGVPGRATDDYVETYHISYELTNADSLGSRTKKKGKIQMIKNLRLKYRMLGSEDFLYARIESEDLQFHATQLVQKDKTKEIFDYSMIDMFVVNDSLKRIDIKPGSWKIADDIRIPENYTLHCSPGTTIDLKNGASIISYGPVYFKGSESAQIKIGSSDNTGSFTVLQAKDLSIIEHVVFEGLGFLDQDGWRLTGAVTFFESDVKISNTAFIRCFAEDALNTIRSSVELINCRFNDVVSDAFDADFCSGTIDGSLFTNLGNDAIDISGSDFIITGVTIIAAGDKAISAGEKSKLRLNEITIRNSAVGLCSKDLSDILGTRISIDSTKVAVTAYKKKEEFGPSYIRLNSIDINNAEVEYLVETKSKVVIDDKPAESNHQNIKQLMYGVKYGKASN